MATTPQHPKHLPLAQQLTLLREILSTNTTLIQVLTRAHQLNIPNWYLAAGSVSQTIWNYMSGFPPDQGISDYDLVYHDASDLSYEAEDAVIQAANKIYADLDVEVEVRNQARVHLWYEKKHGRKCPEHQSVEEGIDSWISPSAMIGIRVGSDPDKEWDVYAPRGLSEFFAMVVRPNADIGTREAYEKKTKRWKAIWNVKVEEWPSQ